MRLIDLKVDRTIPSANSRMMTIVIFKQDGDAYFGLPARTGQYSIGQEVPVLMSSDGESICWPESQQPVAAPTND